MNIIRPKRVSDLVKQEVARIVQSGELRDPRVGFVTITDVETSKDLSFCKIFFSTLENEPQHVKRVTTILNDAKRFFRRQIGKSLSLRIVPEVVFVYDNSAQYGDKMDQLIKEVSAPKLPVSSKLEDVVEFVQKHDDYLLLCHIDPDGDAVGSAMAMALALKKLGKQVHLYCDTRIPETFDFLKNEHIRFLNRDELNDHYNVLMLLDLNDRSRAGKIIDKEGLFLKTMIVDHHITGTTLSYDMAYVRTDYAATGLLVYDILRGLHVEMDTMIAESLYVAIITDTGGFRYESTSAKVFRVAADLLDVGINPWSISQQLYENHSLKRMKLLGGALQSLDIDQECGYASISLSQNLFKSCDANVDERELYDGFVNFPRSIKGVEVAIEFKEIGETKTKISFRSRGTKDVSLVASRFGGGGHKNASGCTLDLSLVEAKETVFAVLKEFFNNEEWVAISR